MLATACSFEGVEPTGNPGDDAAPGSDVASLGDANGCSLASVRVDLGQLPSTPGAPIVIPPGERWNYDTDAGELTDDNGSVVADVSTSYALSDGRLIRVVYTTGLSVGDNDGRLIAAGSIPLAIVSTGPVVLGGRVDVSSDLGATPGAGANQMCGTRAGGFGQVNGDKGGGGGGGAGAADGGIGGAGDGGAAAPGGAGIAPAGFGQAIWGGCPGGRGGAPTGQESDAGDGGNGGGAIEIVSACSILVDDEIRAGGGGGAQANGMKRGGGGGGSGGFIGLQAPEITITQNGFLAANGGGGGEGMDGDPDDGQDARNSTNRADGGSGDGAGNGGSGGARDNPAGDRGEASGGAGGGGGGGGVGAIVLTGVVTENGVRTSPAHN